MPRDLVTAAGELEELHRLRVRVPVTAWALGELAVIAAAGDGALRVWDFSGLQRGKLSVRAEETRILWCPRDRAANCQLAEIESPTLLLNLSVHFTGMVLVSFWVIRGTSLDYFGLFWGHFRYFFTSSGDFSSYFLPSTDITNHSTFRSILATFVSFLVFTFITFL